MPSQIRRHAVPAEVVGAIPHADAGLPLPIPTGHVGPVALPGTGRVVWWTGRVAIGLRHQPQTRIETPSQSALWVQALVLGAGCRRPRRA